MLNPYTNVASDAYREAEVLAASPGRLLVITFDALIVSLTRARVGMTMQNQDIVLASLDKSRGFLGELLAALDYKQGGDIAKQLGALYSFLLGELMGMGVNQNVKKLERITNIVRELRDAFAQIAVGSRREVA